MDDFGERCPEAVRSLVRRREMSLGYVVPIKQQNLVFGPLCKFVLKHVGRKQKMRSRVDESGCPSISSGK
jgi:hypothetical protein